MSKVKIKNKNSEFYSLSLSSVSIHPDYRKKRNRWDIDKSSTSKRERIRTKSIISYELKEYYPRFGYILAGKFDIELPFEVS